MNDEIFDRIRRLQEEINSCFRSFFGRGDFLEKENSMLRKPLVDIEEKEKEVVLYFEIPGVDKKDIKLNVTEEKVELKVEKKKEEKTESKGYYKEERSYQGFYRVVSLPTKVIPEKAKAKYKEGILEVRVPKADQKRKEVEIE
ncbi:MAG: Hsp20/alpha crystallin family protein [Candidatus Pacearchaeota archaeon]